MAPRIASTEIEWFGLEAESGVDPARKSREDISSSAWTESNKNPNPLKKQKPLNLNIFLNFI
jgi:hypothetical protein